MTETTPYRTEEQPVHPDFHSFVSRLEQRLLPELTSLANDLTAVWPGYEMKTFSLRHAEAVHSLGLWCAAPGLDVEDDSRGIIINVIGFEDLSVRGFVEWETCRCGRASRTGVVVEAMTRSYSPQSSGGGVDAFLLAVPSLYRGLRRAFRRGHPPRFPRAWHLLIGLWS